MSSDGNIWALEAGRNDAISGASEGLCSDPVTSDHQHLSRGYLWDNQGAQVSEGGAGVPEGEREEGYIFKESAT